MNHSPVRGEQGSDECQQGWHHGEEKSGHFPAHENTEGACGAR